MLFFLSLEHPRAYGCCSVKQLSVGIYKSSFERALWLVDTQKKTLHVRELNVAVVATAGSERDRSLTSADAGNASPPPSLSPPYNETVYLYIERL